MLGVVHCEEVIEIYFIIMVETSYYNNFLTMLLLKNNFIFTVIIHQH